jgi:actin-related protein
MFIEENINNSLVIDMGSSLIRAGFGGESLPRLVIPSFYSPKNTHTKFGETILKNISSGFEIESILQDNYSFNPNVFKEMFEYLCDNLDLTNQDISVSISEPAHLRANIEFTRKWKESICQILFEVFKLSRVSILPDAVLSTFSHCVDSALIVDFGWSCTRIIPVEKCSVITKAISILSIGGFSIANSLRDWLYQQGCNIGNEFENYQPIQKDILTLIKSSLIFQNYCQFGSQEKGGHLIYNGTDIRPKIDSLSECFWDHRYLFDQADEDPLHVQIKNSIENSSVQYPAKLWNKIIPCGGFSKVKGFSELLERQLSSFNPNVNVCSPMHILSGGDNAVWTGGSIFASSPAFKNMAVSQNEWNESGTKIFDIKMK